MSNRTYIQVKNFKTEDLMEIERMIYNILERANVHPKVVTSSPIDLVQVEIDPSTSTPTAFGLHSQIEDSLKSHFTYGKDLQVSLEID